MSFTTKTPHVEQGWANDFVLALRLRDIRGSAIGSALAEVDSHCADSGEGAQEAFGDATAYADSLEFAGPGDITPLDRRGLAGPVLLGALGVVGMLATVWGDVATRQGTGVAVTVGMVVNLGLLAAAFVALWLAFDRIVALLVRRPVLAWVFFMGLIAVMVAGFALLPTPVTVLPAVPTVVGGVALLAVAAVGEYLQARTGGDPVTGPAQADGVGGDARPGNPRLSAAMAALVLPVAPLVLLGVNRLLG